MKKLLLTISIIIFFLFTTKSFAGADELDDVNKELENLKKSLIESQKATKPLEENLNNIKKQLDDLRGKIYLIEQDLIKKEKEITTGEKTLAYQKKVLNERVFAFYKNSKKNEISLLNILASQNLSTSFQNFFYQKTLTERDKIMIIKIVNFIKSLEEKKRLLEEEKSRLITIKAEVDKQSQFLTQEINKAKKYQGELSQKIAQLTAKQQELIAKKFASIYIPRSAAISYSCKPDYDPRSGEIRDPGFSPKFGFFTFGVPHRVGMNQWGAYGRAKSGQNEEEILRAYYQNFELKKDYSKDITINVEGFGSFNIEDYVKRIYEVPESWPLTVLKAQAIAARSYALAYTNNGEKSICSTEQCQVFKPEPKGGAWEQAVNETAGWVMTQNGQPLKAWYSSTHGGYGFSSSEVGWSNTSWTKNNRDTSGEINSFSDLFEKAYDRESPIFYCNWGSRPEYNKTAWLKSEEVADIVNVILLARADSSTSQFLYQVDAGGNAWSEEKVKDELLKRGINPFSRIDNVVVSADFSYGRTIGINVYGDSGNQTFDGKEFRDWFNARAPKDIQIRGPLYNIEKK